MNDERPFLTRLSCDGHPRLGIRRLPDGRVPVVEFQGGAFNVDADADALEGLAHLFGLALAHEAVVDVDGDHLLGLQGFAEERGAHSGVHAA